MNVSITSFRVKWYLLLALQWRNYQLQIHVIVGRRSTGWDVATCALALIPFVAVENRRVIGERASRIVLRVAATGR